MELRDANPLEVLRSINYVDSSLLGLSIDIFKIRLFIAAYLSPRLKEFGFEEDYGYICAEFRLISNLTLEMNKSVFGPPYLEDGDLSAVDLFPFDFGELKIDRVGWTGETDRLNEYRETREFYKVRFICRNAATLQFQFVTLDLSIFDPLDLDKGK